MYCVISASNAISRLRYHLVLLPVCYFILVSCFGSLSDESDALPSALGRWRRQGMDKA